MPKWTLPLIFGDVMSLGYVGRLSLGAASGKAEYTLGVVHDSVWRPQKTSDLGPCREAERLQHSAYHVATDDFGLSVMKPWALPILSRTETTSFPGAGRVICSHHTTTWLQQLHGNWHLFVCVYVFQCKRSCKIWPLSQNNVTWSIAVVPLHDSEMLTVAVIKFHSFEAWFNEIHLRLI